MSDFVADIMPRSGDEAYMYDDDDDSDDFIAEIRPRGQSQMHLSDRFMDEVQPKNSVPSDTDILSLLSAQNLTREGIISLLQNSLSDLIEKVLTGRSITSIQGQVKVTFQNKENEHPLVLDVNRSYCAPPQQRDSDKDDCLGLNIKFKDSPKVVIEKTEVLPKCQTFPEVFDDKTSHPSPMSEFLGVSLPHSPLQRLHSDRFHESDGSCFLRGGDDRDRLSPSSISSADTVRRLSPRILSPFSDFSYGSRIDSFVEGSVSEHHRSFSEGSDGISNRDDEDNNDVDDEFSQLVIDESNNAETTDSPSCDDQTEHLGKTSDSCEDKTGVAEPVVPKAEPCKDDKEAESPMDLSGDSERQREDAFNSQRSVKHRDQLKGSCDKTEHFLKDIPKTEKNILDSRKHPCCSCPHQETEFESGQTQTQIQPHESRITELHPQSSLQVELSKQDDDGQVLDLTVKKQNTEIESTKEKSIGRWTGRENSCSTTSCTLDVAHPAADMSNTEAFGQEYKFKTEPGLHPPYSCQDRPMPVLLKAINDIAERQQPRPISLEGSLQKEEQFRPIPCLARSVSSSLDPSLRFKPYPREKLADVALKYLASRDEGSRHPKLKDKLTYVYTANLQNRLRNPRLERTLKSVDCNRRMQDEASNLQSKLDNGTEQRVDANSETTLKARLPSFIKSDVLLNEESPVHSSNGSDSTTSETRTLTQHLFSPSRKCENVVTNPDKRHECEFCKKVFPTFHDLEGHSVSEHKRYLCEHCNKSFTARPNRDRHVRFHTGERPYKCDLCNSAFTRGDDLKYHRTTRHPDAQPFVCTNCNANFTWQRDLERHIRHSKCKT